MCMFCRSLFVYFLLAIAVTVHRFTDSDYPFGIFKLFLKPCIRANREPQFKWKWKKLKNKWYVKNQKKYKEFGG
jgi:hypothetical protein